ncbi:hypothetical protein [Paracoccus aestuariivivens]|uniref:PTS EIIA type-2 domain-containing protein n=1 Tax=Paracoccus aestuariivivens TaxID=1820333 RepID=A0A6L6JDT2_9RHOB|nr:hypothetical protein [Paracoccus aestuariivivens]MTH80262.1 hypothetical protein [Paracoccus aestuariivivens]
MSYGALDDAPVSVVLLLLFPLGQEQEALTVLAAAARGKRQPAIREALSEAESPWDIPPLLGDEGA